MINKKNKTENSVFKWKKRIYLYFRKLIFMGMLVIVFGALAVLSFAYKSPYFSIYASIFIASIIFLANKSFKFYVSSPVATSKADEYISLSENTLSGIIYQAASGTYSQFEIDCNKVHYISTLSSSLTIWVDGNPTPICIRTIGYPKQMTKIIKSKCKNIKKIGFFQTFKNKNLS